MAERTSSFFERECARLAREPALTEAEEGELAQRWIERGDRAAADALVRSALPVVLSMARRLRGYGISRDELMAEGSVGLLRAVEKFDRRGVRFRTYATHWVRAHMLAAALRGDSLVARGTGALGAKFFFKLRSARARAEALHGPDSEAVDALLAHQFGVNVEKLRAFSAQLDRADCSLDAPVTPDGQASLLDWLPCESPGPELSAARVERDERVADLLRVLWPSLDARERAVVTRLLDGDSTLAQLATHFGLSRERLRQIDGQMKKRLRQRLRLTQSRQEGPEALSDFT